MLLFSAFYAVFGTSAVVDIMCFAHVIRNCRKRPFVSKNNKILILDDIRKMQLAQNRKIFDAMSALFLKKWKDVERNFVEYFKSEWLGTHSNWFEGAASYTPSTNNALESHNATIKRKVTFRRKLPLNEFLCAMLSMTARISNQFTENKRIIATEPNIPRAYFMRAAEMVQRDFMAFKATTKSSNREVHVFPSESCSEENANLNYYKHLKKREWSSFDEYIKYGYQMFWSVQLDHENWKVYSTCTCPIFFKQYICKHIVAVAIRSNLVSCPDSANPMLLAPKRSGGRPKNATKSLMRE